MGPQQETKFTTSFIPKKPVAVQKAAPVSGGRNAGSKLLSMIGIIIFLGSILLAVGAYGWKIQTEKTIVSQIENLKKARNEFDEKTIAEATRLNERIIAVQNLLNNHVAPSNVFAVLEDITLENVRFRNLDYSTNDDGTIAISGSGSAAGFESVVLQSDEFGATGNFRDVIFSNVQSSEGGNSVTFSVAAALDEQVVKYKTSFETASDLDVFDTEEEAASTLNSFKNIFK